MSAIAATSSLYPPEPADQYLFTDFHLVLFIVEGMVAIALIDVVRRAKDGAQAADRLKARFVAWVVHDLRTPLNAIQGWASQLEGRSDDEAFVRRAAAQIRHSVALQLHLVNDLLDLECANAGKLRLQPRATTLQSVIQPAIDAIRVEADARHVNVSSQFPDTDATLVADPTRLEQVVANLLSNALKFTPAGGDITVTVTLQDSTAEIRVSDSGICIPIDAVDRIFEPYQQVDERIQAPMGGLGLGLAITKELVLLHGGKVTALNESPDGGAVFVVTLPLGGPQHLAASE